MKWLKQLFRSGAIVCFVVLFNFSGIYGQLNCDLNGDGSCDCQDLDVLNTAIIAQNMSAQYDLDNNGKVDFEDKVAWSNLTGIDLADLNLDGEVNFADLVTLTQNEGGSGHCNGDINADGVINEFDLTLFLESFNGGYSDWSGATDSIWHKDANWNPGFIPPPGIKVIIQAENRPAVMISGKSAGIQSLLIMSKGSLKLQHNSQLVIAGSIDPLTILGLFELELGSELDVKIE